MARRELNSENYYISRISIHVVIPHDVRGSALCRFVRGTPTDHLPTDIRRGCPSVDRLSSDYLPTVLPSYPHFNMRSSSPL